MRRRGQSKQKDPKKESAALIAQMARKKGTANDWVNAVLNDAIRSKFQTPSEREAADAAHGGETRHKRELRLARLYDSNASSKLVRRRAKVLRDPVAKNPRELSMKDYNPYGTLDGGPIYDKESSKPDKWDLGGSWRLGYRNSTTVPPGASPLAPLTHTWLSRSMGTLTTRDLKAEDAAAPVIADPWVPPVRGSPHLWPKDAGYVTGFQKKADRFCQPYRPSSRLSHMSYTQLHTKPPPVPHPHEHSLAHTAGPGSGFGVDGGRLVKAEALVQRQPGDNPLFATGSVLEKTGVPSPTHSPALQTQARLAEQRPASPPHNNLGFTWKSTQRAFSPKHKHKPSTSSPLTRGVGKKSGGGDDDDEEEEGGEGGDMDEDGDTYVAEGYRRSRGRSRGSSGGGFGGTRTQQSVFDIDDDDAWTWSSAIDEPVRRVNPRLVRWRDKQASASRATKRSIWKQQRSRHRAVRGGVLSTAPAGAKRGPHDDDGAAGSVMRAGSVASLGSAGGSVISDASRRTSKSRRSRGSRRRGRGRGLKQGSGSSPGSVRSTKSKSMKRFDVVEPRGGLKYWTNFTVMYSRKEDEKTLKAKAQKRARERGVRAQMKWRELSVLWGYLRAPSHRKPGVDEILALYGAFRKVCAESGTEATVDRDHFWQIVSSTELPLVNANRLFSGFDIDRRDEMDIRRFICSLRLFKKPSESLVDKFSALFDIYHAHATSENLLRADVVAALQTCADSELDSDMIDKLAQRAMNNRLGAKSLWAVDVTRDAFRDLLTQDDALAEILQHQFDATVGSIGK